MNVNKIVVGLLNLFCVAAFLTETRAETDPKFYAVQVSATVQASPARITLKWPADPSATAYTVSRKTSAVAPWSTVANLGGTATGYSDANVLLGSAYEYQVTKNTTVGYVGTGYIYTGIQAPLVDSRGKLVLVVDNTYASQLASELTRLEQDLAGDGWIVIRRDVSRTATVPSVKYTIKTEYNADPNNVKAVFLFGHVPVPYSGNLNPDGHPDHQGAWPADLYYGDMDGVWTDSTVNNAGAYRPENRNIPGDGKFDQTDIPSDVELAVGRVDLYNMTCFSNKTPARTELDLLRQYLNKDHNFRHGKLQVPRRGLVCDNFGEFNGEAFAASGWRNFAPMFGAENTVATPGWTFFTTLKSNGYLWAYGTGGGSYTTCNGVGGSDDFANNDIQAVFTMFLGSYFGDWDTESSFLRAPLGSTSYTLTTSWAGRPHWFYHHMALGETIGHSTKLSQNNRYNGTYAKQNYGTRQVHVSLLGDPTLRMHPVLPPFNASVAALSTGVSIAWAASSDTGIVGYHVYRATSPKGPFTRLTTTPLNATAFTDTSGTTSHTYMVRAIKLEQSASGTYYNASQGAFASLGSTPTPTPAPEPEPGEIAPNAPSNLKAVAVSPSRVELTWSDNSAIESGFRLLRRIDDGAWQQIATPAANATAYVDSAAQAGASISYVAYAVTATRISSPSNIPTVTTPALQPQLQTSATFVSKDITTSGSWKNVYGHEGYQVIGDASKVVPYVTANAQGNSYWAWSSSTTTIPALQKANASDRIAACWFNSTALEIKLDFTDSNRHKVSFYFVDYDKGGRQQTIEIIDATSGKLLDSHSLTSFTTGVYLTWELQGRIIVRLRKVAGSNAVLSGIFYGSPIPTSSGSAPKARFLGPNTTVMGNWNSAFGTQGAAIFGSASTLPSSVLLTATGHSDWTWNYSTADASALQKIGSTDRIAACRYSWTSFDLNVKITDGQPRKVSLYSLDWDEAGRTQRIDVLDTATGALLHTATVQAFQAGTWLSWDIAGSVTFRVTRTGPSNAVLSGLFLDAASAPL